MNPSEKQLHWAAQFDVIKLGHLDSYQYTVVLGFLLATKVLLTLPSYITKRVGTGAWLTILVSAALAALGLWGWLGWCKITGNLGFVPSVRLTLGRILGDLVTFVLSVYLVLVTSFSVRVFAGGAVIGLLPEFPIEITLVIVIASAMYAAWLGLETVARAATFLYPITATTLIILALGCYRLFDIRHLFPLLGMGLPVILRESVVELGIFGGISMTAILKSYLREPSHLPRAALRGLSVATALMVASVVLVAAVLPYPENTRHVISLGVIARTVYLGRFLQKIEALFIFTWFFVSAMHASSCYMVTLVLLCQLMNIHTYRPLIPGLALLTFGIAALPGSLHAAGRFLSLVYTYMGSFSVVLGPVLYAVAKLRGTQRQAAHVAKLLGELQQASGYSEDRQPEQAPGQDGNTQTQGGDTTSRQLSRKK